jgi:ABC-type ATPase with predicted acetyltransferase domain
VGIVLVTGASGSGKSTLLRQVEEDLRTAGRECVRLERMALPRRAVVDCFGMGLEETMGLLARAGLGEPRLWLRSPRALSEGERFRFRLAKWMAGPARKVLVADEFGNGLDRVTARGVAWQLRRFVAEGGRAAVVATAHEDLGADLMPARHVRLGLATDGRG